MSKKERDRGVKVPNLRKFYHQRIEKESRKGLERIIPGKEKGLGSSSSKERFAEKKCKKTTRRRRKRKRRAFKTCPKEKLKCGKTKRLVERRAHVQPTNA